MSRAIPVLFDLGRWGFVVGGANGVWARRAVLTGFVVWGGRWGAGGCRGCERGCWGVSRREKEQGAALLVGRSVGEALQVVV